MYLAHNLLLLLAVILVRASIRGILVLPLGRFPVLRSASCDAADASIRTRHPGVYGFRPHGAASGWRISANVLNFERGSLIASQSSAFSIGNMDDGILRVFLPLSQSAEIRTRDRRQLLTPGVVTFAPTGEFGSHFSDGFRGLIAAFPRPVVEEMMQSLKGEADVSTQVNAAFSRGLSAFDPIKRQMLSMVRAFDQTPEPMLHERRFLRAHEELLLIHIAQALATTDKQPEAPTSSRYLARAIDFMRAHLSDEIGPTAIAGAAGCSLRNLQLLFRREFGRTITETVRDMRLQAARERLLSGKGLSSITEVALESGFSHLSDFSRHYRYAFGELPSQTMASARARHAIR